MEKHTDELFDELCEKSGFREIWSLKPFDEGCLYDYYPPGKGPKFGETDPLPDSEIALIVELMGGDCSFNLEHIRVFLQSKCNIQNLTGLTLREICIAFGRYRGKGASDLAGKSDVIEIDLANLGKGKGEYIRILKQMNKAVAGTLIKTSNPVSAAHVLKATFPDYKELFHRRKEGVYCDKMVILISEVK